MKAMDCVHRGICGSVISLFLFASAVCSAQATLTPPDKPNVVSPKGGVALPANSPFVLSFLAVDNVDRYHVLVYDKTKRRWGFSNAGVSPSICNIGGVCRIQVPGMAAQDRTIWKVRGHNSAGWGNYSDNAVFSTESTSPPPSPITIAPQNGQSVYANEPITLSYQELDGVSRYHVLVFDKNIQRWGYSNANVTSSGCSQGICQVVIPGMGPQDRTLWKVRGLNNGGWGEYSASAIFSVEARTSTPAKVIALSPKGAQSVAANSPFVLSFQAVSGVDRYHVLVFDKTKQKWGYSNAWIPVSVCGEGRCRIQVPGMTAQDKTLWKVRAHNRAGWGEYSANAIFSVEPETKLLGPLEYSSFNNPSSRSAISPFANLDFSYFHLEDFESQGLNTPGVSIREFSTDINTAFSDSVDGDDGVIDGMATGNTSSLFSGFGTSSFTFDFNQNALGGYPTHAGIVWTDIGRNNGGTPFAADLIDNVIFEAFDSNGVLIGVIGPESLGDTSITRTTDEDRFLGAISSTGISTIKITMPGKNNWEVDHLQYGKILN